MADIYYLLFIFNKYLQGTVNFLLSTFYKVLLQKNLLHSGQFCEEVK